MADWYRLGAKDDLVARAPFSTKIERHRIAIFVYARRLTAISDMCNHKGGPLSEGRGDGVYVQIPPVAPRKLLKHKPSHLLEAHPKTPGAPCRVLGISTTFLDEDNPRFATSDALLDHAMARAREVGAETQLIKLRSLNFKHCEGNYSTASNACTWPCAITERDPSDQLTSVYGGAGADVINMSLGKATTYAYQRGVTVVVAMGNDAVGEVRARRTSRSRAAPASIGR
jgi:Rieske 2Fe-2S protein